MTDNSVIDARRNVERRFGTSFEKKATNDLCLYLDQARVFESAQTARFNALTIRFAKEVIDRRVSIHDRKRLLSFEEFEFRLRDLPIYRNNRMRFVGNAYRAERVRIRRESALAIMEPVRSFMERAGAHALMAWNRASTGDDRPVEITQVCWLNGTLRIPELPGLLADVAEDPTIEQLDIPRRIVADNLGMSTARVGAPRFREANGVAGRGIVIAVIDGEVAPDHPALAGRVIHQQNYTREPWGSAGSHGTAVAGIVGANDTSHMGVAPEVMIYNYKVLAGSASLNSDTFQGGRAIQDALSDGADIANCSWGERLASDGTSDISQACDEAWNLGMVIVKSAGNRGPSPSSITSPADAEGVIVVGATDNDGTDVTDYSSRGPTADGRDRPHMVAPGGTAADPFQSCLVGGGFGDVGYGTSFAAPHVAGLAALILERDASNGPDDVRRLLLQSCTSIAGRSPNEQGAGLIQLT